MEGLASARHSRASLLQTLLATLLATGCGRGRPGIDHVVVLVLDATQAAELGSYGGSAPTPNLDAVAAAGRVFRRAHANATWTLASTGCLVTGRLQESHGALTRHQRLAEDALTLAEAFRDGGFETAAWVEMLYASRRHGFGQGFEHYAYSPYTGAVRTGEVLARAAAWRERRADERTFSYLHLRRPHSPYDPPRDVAARIGPWPFANGEEAARAAQGDTLGRAELPEDERAGIEYLYRANLATIDGLLGPFLEGCLERDDLLLVVTSDHGEGLGEHGFYGHGKSIWAEVLDVPLIFAGPGVVSGEDRRPASTVDLFPTLAELARLPARRAGGFDGRSLVSRLAGEPAPGATGIAASSRYVPGRDPWIAWIDGHRKVVLAPDGETAVYDRRRDPGERRALDEPADPALVARLRALRELGRERARAAGASRAELTPDEEAELRALGYLAGDGNEGDGDQKPK